MLKIGITGGIATGKSTIAHKLRALGYVVLDADQASHDLTAPGGQALPEIERQFGLDMVDEQHGLNRSKLGTLVFNDQTKLAQLNQIMHPLINQILTKQLSALAQSGQQLVFVEIPLLFETDNLIKMDQVLMVTVENKQTQLKRLLKRSHLSKKEAEQRIIAQMPLEIKEARSDYVLINDNDEHVNEQLNQILMQIRHSLA
ncbi:dephospho-CoA kinase [Weissella kandleri]|uniref:dephospho-CoA kinase n=1 Tax=Weissella kandleri TaxID=1616 RepID=UPI00387EABD0